MLQLAAALSLLLAQPVAEQMRQRQVSEANIVVAQQGSEKITAFAQLVTQGKTDDRERAIALYDAFIALKNNGAIEGDRDNSPKARPPKTAAQLMRIAAASGDYDRSAGCYELSTLYVAAARAIGLTANGIERVDPVGTGQIGHIMAGVEVSPGSALTVFDLQNERRGGTANFRVLDELEFAAHHYNHLAVASFLHGDYAAARAAIDIALRLAPNSASMLNNRATILAVQGESIIALAEASHAIALAPDVPLYRYQLGRLRMTSGDVAGAIESLNEALQLRPSYGLARRDLGWAYLLQGDRRAAESALRRALRDGGDVPDAALYLGLFLLSAGDKNAARQVAADGLRILPKQASLQALHAMAGGAGEADAATVQRLRTVLATLPAAVAP